MALIVESAGGIASTGMFKASTARPPPRPPPPPVFAPPRVRPTLACTKRAALSTPWQGAIHRMLDLVPTDIHERCPVILGCPRDVNKVLDFYKGA